MFPSWWRRSNRGQSKRTAQRPAHFRPTLESLESRIVLNNHTWIGSVSGAWSVAANWAGGVQINGISPASSSIGVDSGGVLVVNGPLSANNLTKVGRAR
jgi:hypothetical protein